MKPNKPEDLFRAEKERALTARNSQHARLLAEAKAAFDKLMAEGQAARKSGRPRKHPLPPLKTSSSRTPPRPPMAAPTPVPAPKVEAARAPVPANRVAKKPARSAAVKPSKPAKTARAKPAKTAAASRGSAKKVAGKSKGSASQSRKR